MINTCASSDYKKLGGNLRWPGIDFSPSVSPHIITPPSPGPAPMTTETTLQCSSISQLINIITGLPLHFITQSVSLKRACTNDLKLKTAFWIGVPYAEVQWCWISGWNAINSCLSKSKNASAVCCSCKQPPKDRDCSRSAGLRLSYCWSLTSKASFWHLRPLSLPRDKASVDSSRKSGSQLAAEISKGRLSVFHAHRKRQIFEKEIPRKGLWGGTSFLTCHLASRKSFTPSGILLFNYFAFSITVQTEFRCSTPSKFPVCL